jgi:hypothetical protein
MDSSFVKNSPRCCCSFTRNEHLSSNPQQRNWIFRAAGSRRCATDPPDHSESTGAYRSWVREDRWAPNTTAPNWPVSPCHESG